MSIIHPEHRYNKLTGTTFISKAESDNSAVDKSEHPEMAVPKYNKEETAEERDKRLSDQAIFERDYANFIIGKIVSEHGIDELFARKKLVFYWTKNQVAIHVFTYTNPVCVAMYKRIGKPITIYLQKVENFSNLMWEQWEVFKQSQLKDMGYGSLVNQLREIFENYNSNRQSINLVYHQDRQKILLRFKALDGSNDDSNRCRCVAWSDIDRYGAITEPVFVEGSIIKTLQGAIDFISSNTKYDVKLKRLIKMVIPQIPENTFFLNKKNNINESKETQIEKS